MFYEHKAAGDSEYVVSAQSGSLQTDSDALAEAARKSETRSSDAVFPKMEYDYIIEETSAGPGPVNSVQTSLSDSDCLSFGIVRRAPKRFGLNLQIIPC